jgi:hypothetical protein
MKEKQLGNQQLGNTQMILFCCHMKLQRAKLSILEPHSHKTVMIMDGIQKETGHHNTDVLRITWRSRIQDSLAQFRYGDLTILQT